MKKNEIYKIGKDLGIDDNKIEKIILNVTGLSKSQLFLCDIIDKKYIESIKESFNSARNGKPIEYIINNAEFYGLDFYVDNRVLIPRNDTEVMVEKALEELTHNPFGTSLSNGSKNSDITLIDVGTGSSCIAISILKNIIPHTLGNSIKNDLNINSYVIDISKEALDVSKINIIKNGLVLEIEQIEGDLLAPLLTSPYQGRNSYKTSILNSLPLSGERGYILNKKVIITANLPYIKNQDFENMDYETIKYEPDIALYGGKETGFELYEKLILQCIKLKEVNKINSIILFIEIGFDQKEVSEKYLGKLGLEFEIFKDNSLIERCVKIIF